MKSIVKNGKEGDSSNSRVSNGDGNEESQARPSNTVTE
jgi:hypothetical protein